MKIRQTLLPLLTALIWGMAFVAQSVSADHVGPFTFNAARAAIAFVTLLIVCAVFDASKRRRGVTAPAGSKRDLLVSGLCCGAFIALATNLQQIGMADTSAGKAGFITALYVVLVPLFGIFLRRKASFQVWISVAVAVVGLYLLCISGSFEIASSDLYVLLCAVVFSLHILCVDHFAARVDGVRLSCLQFLVAAVLSGVCALIFEEPDLTALSECIWPLLYVGVFSSGVAYTLQILAQKDSDPAVVSILLSLESVFSVIAGAIILNDRMSAREYMGCVLMFVAVLLAQIPVKRKRSDR